MHGPDLSAPNHTVDATARSCPSMWTGGLVPWRAPHRLGSWSFAPPTAVLELGSRMATNRGTAAEPGIAVVGYGRVDRRWHVPVYVRAACPWWPSATPTRPRWRRPRPTGPSMW